MFAMALFVFLQQCFAGIKEDWDTVASVVTACSFSADGGDFPSTFGSSLSSTCFSLDKHNDISCFIFFILIANSWLLFVFVVVLV